MTVRIANRGTAPDWFRMLADLNAKGLSNRRVARRLGVTRTALAGWKRGGEPRYTHGARLLELWVEVTGNPSTQAPQRDPFGWR